MFRKMAFVVMAVVASVAVGCAGETGKGEGESCSSATDCAGQLQCQPVYGRNGQYCCPQPLQLASGQFTSSQTNCQPTGGIH
jgi:hypothetical protein